MNSSNNPPIRPTLPSNGDDNQESDPFKSTNQKANIFDSNTSNNKQSLMNSKQVLDSVVKLALKHSPTHQLKNEELIKAGVPLESCDLVREAISKSDRFRNNFILAFFSGIFSQVGGFVDTVFKVLLVFVVFLLSLQVPYINAQANTNLQEMVSEAEFNYNKYEITVEQFSEIMKKYKIDPANAAKEVPQQVKQDKEKAERWIKYKDQSVESLIKSSADKPNESQTKIEDLKEVYSKTFKNYKPGLPEGFLAYRNAAFASVIILVLYILLQNLFAIFFKSFFRASSLRGELRKVL